MGDECVPPLPVLLDLFHFCRCSFYYFFEAAAHAASGTLYGARTSRLIFMYSNDVLKLRLVEPKGEQEEE